MWKNFNINKQNIKADTGRAVLIAMPNSSDYKGFAFWHPAKLVRDGRHSNAVSISYTEDFEFRLIKNGNGKYNKYDIIDSKTISFEELEEAFGVMNENIIEPKIKSDYETHKPIEVKATEIDALDELKDE